ADRIARSLGIELDDPQRLRAGLLFVLEQAESDGHTFLPLDELWQAAAKLLEVGELEQLESAVRALVLAAEVVVDGERTYVSELYEMECRLGLTLGERARARPVELFAAP
ncbi:MAG: helix-hairpin-helix domain-containing protein, partial [Gaiellaceae bacterium]